MLARKSCAPYRTPTPKLKKPKKQKKAKRKRAAPLYKRANSFILFASDKRAEAQAAHPNCKVYRLMGCNSVGWNVPSALLFVLGGAGSKSESSVGRDVANVVGRHQTTVSAIQALELALFLSCLAHSDLSCVLWLGCGLAVAVAVVCCACAGIVSAPSL